MDCKSFNLERRDERANSTQGKTSQEEPTKPLFDINAEDLTTQKLLEQFATKRFSKAVDDADIEPVNFFNGMFDDKDKFQNTPENRNAIITRYGDEFKTWTANQNQQTQKPQQDNSFDNGFSLKQAVNLIS